MELPFWLASILCMKSSVTLELPRCFQPAYREMLLADPSNVNLRGSEKGQGFPFFYEFGCKISSLIQSPEVAGLMCRVINVRYQEIVKRTADRKQHESLKFKQGLCNMELQCQIRTQRAHTHRPAAQHSGAAQQVFVAPRTPLPPLPCHHASYHAAPLFQTHGGGRTKNREDSHLDQKRSADSARVAFARSLTALSVCTCFLVVFLSISREGRWSSSAEEASRSFLRAAWIVARARAAEKGIHAQRPNCSSSSSRG